MLPRTECAGSGELLPPREVILRGGGEGDCLSFGHPVSSDTCLFLGTVFFEMRLSLQMYVPPLETVFSQMRVSLLAAVCLNKSLGHPPTTEAKR